MLEKYSFGELNHTNLSVYNYGREYCCFDHRWGPGVQDHYIIHLVISRRGHFSLNGSSYSLESGQIFLMPANYLAQVEYSVGYEDPLLFSKVLKKKKGSLPASIGKNASANLEKKL